MGIKEIIIACAATGMLCFGAGYYTKTQFDQADQFKAVTQTRQTDAKNVQQSVATSASVEASVTALTNNIHRIQNQIATRLKPKEIQNASAQAPTVHSNAISDHDAAVAGGNGCTLDVGTVGLLNAARTGSTSDAAAIDNDQSQAPSGIDLAAIIDNDLEVVGLYHELATRHDALVDYVTALVNQQAE